MKRANARSEDVSKCKICALPAEGPFLELPSCRDHLSIQSFRAFHCRSCGLIFVSPDPAESDLFEIYNSEDYNKSMNANPRWRRWVIDHHWGPLLTEITMRIPPGRLLDVGCSDGLFLDLALERGFEAYGIDVNEELVRLAKRNHKERIVRDSVYTMDWPEDRFDAVRLCHVLEHLPDPMAALGNIHRVLRPGGLLSAGTPVLDEPIFFLLNRVPLARLKRKLFKVLACLFPPEHLTTWSFKALRRALESTGFEVIWNSYRSDVIPLIKGYRRYWMFYRAMAVPFMLLRTGVNIEVLARKVSERDVR